MGFAGVGGGFIITPALVMFAKLQLRTAIGTSLVVITLNSFVGFYSSVQLTPYIDWKFILLFILITSSGMLLGSYASRYVNSRFLNFFFGSFIIITATFIIISEMTGIM